MKKVLKLLLKIVGVLAVLTLIGVAIAYVLYNEPLPEGNKGPKADMLAEKMLLAINYEQYQKTRFLEWSYIGGKHQYKWDKTNGKVAVLWSDNKVNLNLNSLDKSLVYDNNAEVVGDDRAELIETALKYFNNDSFWLVAPFKVFDKGATRSIVALEDGNKGLLVSYSTGGTTPGDSYLWKLNDNGFPESYQMWVKIIPIGGLEASWDEWKIMKSGVLLPTSHELGPLTLSMGEVAGYN